MIHMSSTLKIVEVRVSKLAANIVGTLLTVVCCVACILIAHALPHYRSFDEGHTVPLLVCLFVLFPLHELLHAMGLHLFAGVPWANIKFGVLWRALIPYCHCKIPIPVAAYRRMVLLPLWITGGLSLSALLVFPTDGVAILAGIALAACVGDVWIVAKLRGFADDLLIQDSPSEIGCDVLSPIS